MKLGVTYPAWRVNAFVTAAFAMLIVHTPLGFAVGIGIHLGLKEVCRYDPHFFDKWMLFCNTKCHSKSGVLWGGSRLQPSHSDVRYASEVRSSV